MVIFLESPWPILFIGIAVEAVLAIVLLRTGRVTALWGMIGVAAFVLLGLLVEWLVVTDHEAVQHTLDAAVAAVEANDIERLLSCIAPSAQQARKEARWVLDRVEVKMARINDLEIKINHLTSPPTATAKFQAIGTGRDRKGEFPYQTFAQKVTVELRQEKDAHWLVAGYNIEDLKLP
jgi:hypothetical protein